MTKEKMTDQERVEIVKEYFDQLPKEVKSCFRCPNCQRHIDKNYNLKESIQEFIEELKEEFKDSDYILDYLTESEWELITEEFEEKINELTKQKFGEALI